MGLLSTIKSIRLFSAHPIYGCAERWDRETLYLWRIHIVKCDAFALMLHVFHRSDDNILHDHPWKFWSLMLWGGYREYYRNMRGDLMALEVRPGTLSYRPAKWIHRVELKGRRCVTIVLRLNREREWGFWIGRRWEHWKEYFRRNRC